MEHTVNSLRVTSGSYPRISSDVSELYFQSRVLESTLVDRKQRYTIEYQQSHAGQQVEPRPRTGHANITINYVRHQASTKTFQSCDIDKIMTGHEDCVFQVMMFAGILHHLKILCKGLGISHLTYGKDDTTTGIGGFLPLLGFKRCACTDRIGPSRCCIAIPSTQRVGEEVPLNDRAQGARVGANVMHSASDEDDLSTMTYSLDRCDKFQKHQLPRDKKVYCTHWLSKGNCAYMQQGCIYKHEIPKDQETWESLGFHTLPGWLQAKSSAWINQHLRKSPDLSENLSAEGSGIARRSQSQINTLQNLREENGDRPPPQKWLNPRPDLSRTALSIQSPSLFKGPSSSDRPPPQKWLNARPDLSHMALSTQLPSVFKGPSSSDSPPAHKGLRPRPDLSHIALSTHLPSLRSIRGRKGGRLTPRSSSVAGRIRKGPSSSDRFARPCNKRAHPSSADITRKRARNDGDDLGHTTSNPRRPRYQKDSFPAHAKEGTIESGRLHSTDSIDDPGYHVRSASRGRSEHSREPSHQPPPHWSTASAGSTSGASCGNDYFEDPVLQASQFLGDWQVETPDVVWGSYPSHESYPPNRTHYLRDPYRPGKP